MSFFVTATDPPQPKTKNVRKISLLLAGILLAMVVAQLFSFEKFPNVIADMHLPGGEVFAKLRAALIVTFEVFALPFLLGMRLSPAMRIVSMVAGWAVVMGWLAAAILMDKTVNSGLLGATVPLASGWWMIFFVVGLGVLVAWSAWGMWPLKPSRQK